MPTTPEVGMDATFTILGNQFPYKVEEITRGGKSLKARMILKSGKRSPLLREFTLRGNGEWLAKGDHLATSYGRFTLGEAHSYIDLNS